jgi:hypothetical protein
MPIACFLAKHAMLDEADFRAIQAIISTYIKGRYGDDPEFIPFEDYFTVNNDLEIVEGEQND